MKPAKIATTIPPEFIPTKPAEFIGLYAVVEGFGAVDGAALNDGAGLALPEPVGPVTVPAPGASGGASVEEPRMGVPVPVNVVVSTAVSVPIDVPTPVCMGAPVLVPAP